MTLRNAFSRIAVAGLLVSVGSVTPALGLVIDDFAESEFTNGLVADDTTPDGLNTPGVFAQAGLSPAHTVGGVRGVRVWLGSGSEVLASYVKTTVGNGVEFLVPEGSEALRMELDYGVFAGAPPLLADLTEGGAHDRLLIEIPQVTGAISVSLFIEVMNGGIESPEVVVTSPTTLSFMLSDLVPSLGGGPVSLPGDLTSIHGFMVAMSATGPASIQVSGIRTAADIPEPGTAATLGILGLAVFGRHITKRRVAGSNV